MSEKDEPTRSPGDLAELSQQGYQFLRENLLSEAEARFSEILEMDPENNYALVGLGDSARKRRHYEKAIGFYERCLEIHPDNNYALFGLADCYRSLKHFNKALRVWERYLQHDDENVTVLTRVADAHRKVRNFDRSKELYDRVLEKEPDNAYALIGLGHLHYDFRDFEGALHYWERMYEISGPKVDIRVLTSLGNCHRKQKTFAEGVRYFEEALRKEPNNFYALFGMADCCRGMGKAEESLAYWNRILERDPENKVILTRAGDAYQSLGDTAAARSYYERALDIEFDAYAVLGLAVINRLSGKTDDAIVSLEGLVKNDSKNPRFYYELAESYLEQGNRERALDTLDRALAEGAVNRQISALRDRLEGTR